MQDSQPDIHQALARLRRPPLLVRAARLGTASYARDAVLPQLLGAGTVPTVRAALARLIEVEAAQDDARRAGAIHYRAAHHVALLIAVMGEAQLLDREQRAAAALPGPEMPGQENASGMASLRVAT